MSRTCRPTVFPISDGLRVEGQNFDGSLESDRGALIGALRQLPAGRLLLQDLLPPERRLEALGADHPPARRPRAGERVRPPRLFRQGLPLCDVAVIGGGPAGLSAALARGARRRRRAPRRGEPRRSAARLTYARFDAEGARAAATLAALRDQVAAEPGITVMTDAVCTGLFADNWLSVIKGNRLYKLRARKVVLATGSIEQPLVFRNNDLPGIMLALGGAAPDPLYSACGPAGAPWSLTGQRRRLRGRARPDRRREPRWRPSSTCRAGPAALRPRRRRARPRRPRAVRASPPGRRSRQPGNRHVRGVVGARDRRARQGQRRPPRIDCDLLCMSVGFTPTHQLLLACRRQGPPTTRRARMFAVSERAAGSLRSPARLPAPTRSTRCMAEGASRPGTRQQPRSGSMPAPRPPFRTSAAALRPIASLADLPASEGQGLRRLRRGPAGRGHRATRSPRATIDIELVKRYSTVGMGPSQGRHSALNAARLTAEATGQDLADGRPHHRAAALRRREVGRARRPRLRAGAPHRDASPPPRAGRQMMPAGLWLRPGLLRVEGGARAGDPRGGCCAVRTNVGMIDVSTLGGLEVRGPDAAEFLDRMYTFAYKKQEVGRSRYVLMTDEAGVIIDDGVACRLARGAFLRHRDDQRRRQRLPRHAVVERAVAARRRRHQRHRRLCRRQHRRAALARGAAAALHDVDLSRRGVPLPRRADRARSPAFRRG